MSINHIIVAVFMLITAAFVIWLEINSRKNANKEETATEQVESSSTKPRANS